MIKSCHYNSGVRPNLAMVSIKLVSCFDLNVEHAVDAVAVDVQAITIFYTVF